MTLYLAGRWQGGLAGDTIEVPASTLISLFTLQYCQNRVVRVVLLPDRVNTTCVFPVSLHSLVFPVVLQRESECLRVLQCCDLPAMVLLEEEEEEEEKRKGIKRRDKEEEEEGEKSEVILENGGKNEEEEEEEEKEEKKKEEEEEEKKSITYQEDINKSEKKEEEEEKEGGGGEGGGVWCCAGLCSSLRLAVKEITRRRRGGGGGGGGGGGSGIEDKQKIKPETRKEKHEKEGEEEEEEEGRNKENKTKKDEKERQTNHNITQHHATHLLGFRGGCLQACAEVSVWTKFCEVEAPAALLSVALHPYSAREAVVYPVDVLRYEHHLRRPPILHNALKRTQQHIRDTFSGAMGQEMCRRPLALLPTLAHQFAEGLDMTLADLMLFVCFHLILHSLTSANIVPANVTPLVHAWHSTLALDGYIQAAMPVLELAQSLVAPQTSTPSLEVPEVEDVSIYKSDPERNKSRGFFTKQGDVEEVLRLVEEAQVEEGYLHCPPHSSSSSAGNLMFSSFLSLSSDFLSSSSSSSATNSSSSSSSSTKEPSSSSSSTTNPSSSSSSSSSTHQTSSSFTNSTSSSLHTLLSCLSLEGHVPQSRLERKTQQLQNICSATLSLAKPGHTIVDFCAGAGHVGIPLAQCLPDCHILLVENKTPSLERARVRVQQLGLKNVSFIQSNLDYFRGSFDIGVSLHACGAATDLVLGKCVAKQAAFVVVPCCYGSIRPNHVVSYPRSLAFHALQLTPEQYLTLGHAADQTHGSDNPKTAQGQRCMRVVDGDRLAEVREAGYKAALALMQPPTCSPKNHLLLGVFR
ncbi:Glutathione S-transferase C-terminal domain-containing [Portunus trituberculatus]|uniref:Glutathione S-transferase C-terminal domain-containing n=1 Tax=Portunus trituberculatus TaxID=210409 RepID=A0A5B7DUR3_PORTR|nr:Glutathione S-transferase C-terminal domain-containing [Portunus trituberculatus]